MFARLMDEPRRTAWLVAASLTLFWLVIYLTTLSPTVNFIDSGELITALHGPGIAHPPGYPLYTLLGYVASRLPFGDVAWRVNAMSAFWGALAVGAFFLLLFRLSLFIQPRPIGQPALRTGKRVRAKANVEPAPAVVKPNTSARVEWLFIAGAAAGASLLAASSTFWSRTAQAKMYSLHFFLLSVLFLLALGAREAYDRKDLVRLTRWLVAIAAVLGLAFANHLMTAIAVVPLALLFLVGDAPRDRFMAAIRRLLFVVPAFLLPLLLYLYMPLRATQQPVMNWGSTDNWGDFWRHVTGWQFRTYLTADIPGNISRNTGLLAGYAGEQWGFLTIVVLLIAVVGAVLLARASLPVFVSTAIFAVLTLAFDLVYGISEIEPYIVPLYMVACIWAGLIPAAWLALRGQSFDRRSVDTGLEVRRQAWMAAGVLGALALVSAVLVYPKQNYCNNRLAEQFALNVFNELPEKSIVITDYWDFYAPTYYLQMLQGVRPDIVLIDKSLLRYPWYTDQLRKRYPWLIERSQDIVDRFGPEQRRWVNGDLYDPEVINTGYFDLLTSFVERNYPEYTPYAIWLQDCPPGAQCEANLIAPDWLRQPAGLTSRLWPPGTAAQELPPEPEYSLRGITTEPVSFDTFARVNSQMYRQAYLRLADLYGRSGRADAAERMNSKARELATALEGR